jgi:hypothetical protein
MLKVVLREVSGFNKTEKEKLFDAAKHMEAALNSIAFKEFCMTYATAAHFTTGRLWWKKKETVFHVGFHDTPLSNMVVYDAIMGGGESLEPMIDGEADIFVSIDRSWSRSAIGYTYANTAIQYIYSRFFNGSSIYDIAGNLAHEWMHKLGFEHDYKYSALRDHTVPYAVGEFVRKWRP